MAERPVRLRLSRKRGFDLQAVSRATNGLPAVNVARPSRYGNQFKVYEGRDASAACALFRAAVTSTRTGVGRATHDLAGKNFACWCEPDSPCHADVLLEIANRDAPRDA